MAPVLRKRPLKRPTPARGTRNVYENCLASDPSTFTVRGGAHFPSQNANGEDNIPRSSSQQQGNSYGRYMAEINEISNIGVSNRDEIMNALGAKTTKEKGVKKVSKKPKKAKKKKPLKSLKAKAKKPKVQNKSTYANFPEEPFELPESSNNMEPMQQDNVGQIQDSTIQNSTNKDSIGVPEQSSESNEKKGGFIGFVKGLFY
ncbi:uncharacterized protein LOC108136406 [Drosophila elegans]|uniref:uncharacterized protein LOC108136406 n=1 Tax=Drosophila elegans TaxID=30023 RepID=UPI0007E6614C|nr:uncharacterized protein LOC108136406 [Drosophila elegans]